MMINAYIWANCKDSSKEADQMKSQEEFKRLVNEPCEEKCLEIKNGRQLTDKEAK